jgi:TolB protein
VPSLDTSVYGDVVFACQGFDVDICATSPDEWQVRYLTSSDSIDIDPSWAYGGTKVAFASDRNTRQVSFDIFVLDLAQGSLDQLTSGPGYDRNPSWSPDGTRLTFDRDGEGVFLVTFPENEPARVDGSDSSSRSAAWSPIADQVAFLSRTNGAYHLKIADFQNDSLATIPGVLALPAAVAWDPTGASIAFTAQSDCKLWLVHISDGQRQPLSSGPGCDRDPAWSFDGRYIIFTSNRDTPSDLYLLDTQTAELSRVTTSALADSPSWSPVPSAP